MVSKATVTGFTCTGSAGRTVCSLAWLLFDKIYLLSRRQREHSSTCRQAVSLNRKPVGGGVWDLFCGNKQTTKSTISWNAILRGFVCGKQSLLSSSALSAAQKGERPAWKNQHLGLAHTLWGTFVPKYLNFSECRIGIASPNKAQAR